MERREELIKQPTYNNTGQMGIQDAFALVVPFVNLCEMRLEVPHDGVKFLRAITI